MNRPPDSVLFHVDETAIRTIYTPDVVPNEGDIVRLVDTNTTNETEFERYRVTAIEHVISNRIQVRVAVEPAEEIKVEL